MPKSDIHRYELVERIAVGGMAEVFRAKTYGLHGFEKELAVKRILPELVSNREFVDRFISEAKIAVTLNHANIVQVTDFSRFADSLYIAMEYVDGIDLSALLKALRDDDRVMPLAAALHICIEVLKGLDFAHSRGVVHRDISPANILLSKSGEVKIADFGIAQASEGGSGHTEPFRIMGKWRYMSPEQSLGEKLDKRSDIFSFAIVMFELFTGDKLFGQEDVAQIVGAIRFQKLASAGSLRPDLPAAIDEILAQALQRNPEDRGDAGFLGRALIEVSYAKTIPVTASDLAVLVREYSREARSGEDTSSNSGALIDAIINSELDERRPGINTRLTRLTPVDKSSNAADFETGDSTLDGSATNLTFVDGGLGSDGITQWILEAVNEPETDVHAPAANILEEQRRTEPMPYIIEHEVPAYRPAPAAPLLPGPIAPAYSSADATRGPSRTVPVLVVMGAIGIALAITLVVAAGDSSEQETASSLVASTRDASAAPTVFDAETAVGDASVDVDAREMVMDAEELPSTGTLIVDTRPSGALVTLGGERLGRSPLHQDLPSITEPQRLEFSLDGYRTESRMLELQSGEVVRIDQQLRERTQTGKIDLFVKPWAQVYLGSKKIGEAPARGLTLPYGTHRLRLLNPVTGAEKTVTVQVPADRAYRFSLAD